MDSTLKPFGIKQFGILALLVFLSACVTRPDTDQTDLETGAIVDGEVLPLPDEPTIQVQSMSSEQPMSSVVRNLMADASVQRGVGNLEAAANSLERALRIEPRNARLWSRLANVRYAQQAWQQAIQMAVKSNTLASGDRSLRRQNWYLMANAYDASGNEISAQKYREKLTEK